MNTAFSLSASKLGLLFEFLEKRGMARDAFCARIGLDPAALELPDNRIPLDMLERIFALGYEVTGDDQFGLHFGVEIEKGPSNILNYLMMNCGTIEEVLKTYCAFEVIQDDISQTEYRCADGLCTVTALVRAGSPFFRAHYLESKFASMVYYAKRLTGKDLSLREVQFMHAPHSSVAEYERIFRCPVRFGGERNRIILPCSDLGIKIREPNRELREVFERHAREMLNDQFHTDSYAAKVGRIILQHIPGGIPHIDTVASSLGMSVRTLQLKLKEEETTYRAILDSVRMDMAMDLLRDQSLAITEIAFMLGFSEPSVFHRTFKKWTHTTPRLFRMNAEPPVPPRSPRA